MPLSSVVGAQSIIKPGVCTSSTRPAVPFEGQVIFETDTDRLYVYNGTAWVIPNSPAQNPQGLELITTVTCSSGGTASGGVITVGSGVASVTASSAFSATYDNYRIIYQMGDANSIAELRLTLNNSAGATYSHGGIYVLYGTATVGVETVNNVTTGIRIGNTQIDLSSIVFDVISPFGSTPTHVVAQHADSQYWSYRGGRDSNVASHTAFTLAGSSGTLTGGTIRVYGYRNS